MADPTTTIQMTTTVNGASFTAEDLLKRAADLLVDDLKPDAARYLQTALQAVVTGMEPAQLAGAIQSTIATMDAGKLWPIWDRNGYIVRTGSQIEMMQNVAFLRWGDEGVTVLSPAIPAPDGSNSAQLGAPAAAPAVTG